MDVKVGVFVLTALILTVKEFTFNSKNSKGIDYHPRPFNTRHLDLSGVWAIDGRDVKIHNGGHAHVNVQNKPTFNKIWLDRTRAAAKMDVGMWKHIFQHSNSIFLT